MPRVAYGHAEARRHSNVMRLDERYLKYFEV